MGRLTERHLPEFQAIRELCRRGLTSAVLRERVGDRLARHLGLSSFCFGATDPVTALPVHSLSVGLAPGAMQSFFGLVLSTPSLDFAPWLAARRRVARLEALVDDLEVDPYYRQILRPSGLRHDVQVSCAEDGWSLGHLCLRRAEGRPPFAGHELRFLDALVPHLCTGLKAAAARAAQGSTQAAGTGLIVLGPDGRVELANQEAERLLRLPASGTRQNFLSAVHVLAARLEQSLRDPEARQQGLPSVTFIDELSQRSYRLRAERVPGADGRERGVVFVEPAAAPCPSEQRTLLARFGLSRRECEVAIAVLQGYSNDAIAQTLHMSPHTVTDHLRRAFDKVGVGSRQQLAVRLLGGS